MDIAHYLTASGRDPYKGWLDGLKDLKGRIAVQRRIDRLTAGNFGDHNFCQDGVWELRIDVGPGYRVYYVQAEKELLLLLCGGSKRTQSADIKAAVKSWHDYQTRNP